MPSRPIAALTLAALVAGCQARHSEPAVPTASADTNTLPAAPAMPAPQPSSQPASPAPPASGAPGTTGGLPDDRTPLNEGPIDPKSAEGAGQVLQTYGALLEERKFGEAWGLWGDGGKASGLTRDQFAAAYAKYAAIHAEVGKPGMAEGAAGSSYVEVPFRLYGTVAAGGRFNLVGPVTLRRVNDVDGSTAAQRRWHLASSGLKPRP